MDRGTMDRSTTPPPVGVILIAVTLLSAFWLGFAGPVIAGGLSALLVASVWRDQRMRNILMTIAGVSLVITIVTWVAFTAT
jgi:hypothetical protein